ncbi:MAG TPA: 16S rRNA (cytidine(1402)-2'-O)-methyltransferase [Candidatus Pseudogracilibacillus intestinigallinarum]|uniref:Ribosomal RNA small subunit methyltransferase I n=1 Tax=Candidatus Pseudogracilibacillus intestinigallinarum TaxID=2838742 RepID=A0A9D1TK74_9BACI|nr:16S rRNA (cytidine(1402)-2'-O)-methyltransferase [Candidatus Pseudogracilibacillus intestinigallinarum]
MFVQNSFEKEAEGILYLVPTPIGNLEDITFRALETLKKVDVIAAEDTRHTQKLLNHFHIQKELISYHEHNRMERVPQLLQRLEAKETIALVSDAGMPAISDPGYELVRAVTEKQIHVIPLPGANAATTALIASGLPTDAFYFYGFLPRKKQEKEDALSYIGKLPATIILYESPYRIKDTLKMMEKVLGNRDIVLARELTKLYEQFVRGSVKDVIKWLDTNEIKGECCILIEGAKEAMLEDENIWWENLSIEVHVQTYETKEGLSNKEAMKRVAKDRRISKREVYQHIHIK